MQNTDEEQSGSIFKANLKSRFKSYEEAHTEWTIFVIKFIEACLTLTCLVFHIQALSNKSILMPHHVIFCASFGGFFILSVAGMLVPISGQLSPPGVDLMFGILAFVLLFASACTAMYYIANDKYLKDDKIDDYLESHYPFFITCYHHCVLSLITATFFMMHAVMSADRLIGQHRGWIEDERDDFFSNIPEVDIPEDAPLSLSLFFLDYMYYLYRTRFCRRVRRFCTRTFARKEKEPTLQRYKSRRHLSPHQKAHLKSLKFSQSQRKTAAYIETANKSPKVGFDKRDDSHNDKDNKRLDGKSGEKMDDKDKLSENKNDEKDDGKRNQQRDYGLSYKDSKRVVYHDETREDEDDQSSDKRLDKKDNEQKQDQKRNEEDKERCDEKPDEKDNKQPDKNVVQELGHRSDDDRDRDIKKKHPVIWFSSEVQEQNLELSEDSDEEDLPDFDHENDEPVIWFSSDHIQKSQNLQRDDDTEENEDGSSTSEDEDNNIPRKTFERKKRM